MNKFAGMEIRFFASACMVGSCVGRPLADSTRLGVCMVAHTNGARPTIIIELHKILIHNVFVANALIMADRSHIIMANNKSQKPGT